MANPRKSSAAQRRVSKKISHLVRREKRTLGEASALAWAMERRGELTASGKRKRKTMATRRRPSRPSRRRRAPARRRRVVRARSNRRPPARRRSPSRRRRTTRRNPRALWQTEAFQIGLGSLAGAVASVQLQRIADEAEAAGTLLQWLSPTIAGYKVPAGVIGAGLTLLVIGPMVKRPRTRKIAVGAAAGMLIPATLAMVNPRQGSYRLGSLGVGGQRRRIVRPRRGQAASLTQGFSPTTASIYRLSTIPA